MMKFFVLGGICFLAGLGGGVSYSQGVKIIAHRGASYYAPENTMASVNLGWEMNSDAVEIDILLSSDYRIMVNHDGTTGRTAGGVDYLIRETPSEVLRQLDVGSFKGEEFAGEKMPFLEEVIATVPEGKQLFLDVKAGPEIVPAMKQVLEESGKMDRMVIIGFGYDTMVAAKKAMPDVPVYWLVMNRRDPETNEFPPALMSWIDQAKEGGLDGLNLHYPAVGEEFAEAILKTDLGFYVWTVNNPAHARRMVELGVHGITTDIPDILDES